MRSICLTPMVNADNENYQRGSREDLMALVPNNTLITATPEEGRELAVMLARKSIGAIQTDADVRAGLRGLYANSPDSLTAAAHVIAVEFATVAAANNYWR